MRTITAAQQAVLDSGVQAEFARLSVKDPDGNWRDLTQWPGFDAVEQLSWRGSVGDPNATFEAKLKRELFLLSLSPYVEGSALNTAFGATSFAALLVPNRLVKIEAAIVPMDTEPADADWMEVFRGRIDRVGAADGPCVSISGRDLAGRLAQQYIKLERVYAFGSDAGLAVSMRVWAPEIDVTAGEYLVPASRGADDPGFNKFLKCATTGTTGTTEPVWTTGSGQADGSAAWDYVGAPSTAGFDVEQIMQNILDDNEGIGDSSVTLHTPSSPGWEITEYLQQRGFTLDAVRTLATQIGWDVRELYSEGDAEWQLVFSQPDRDSPSVAHTFAAKDYAEPTKLDVDIANIRNHLKLIFRDKADLWPDGTAKRKEREYKDDASIAKYGDLWSEIQEDELGNVDTSTEADSFGAAFISDCCEPTAEFACPLTRGFPWAELNDFYTFESDGVRADGSLSLAVTAVTQTYEKGHLVTQLELRGKPTIGHEVHLDREWHPWRPPKDRAHRMEHFAAPTTVNPDFKTIVGGIQVDFPMAGAGKKETLLAEYEVHVSDAPGFTPDDTSLLAVVKGSETSIPWQVPDTQFYGKVVPRWYNDGKVVRGQPSVEKAFTSGQAQADHLKQEVEWGRLPLNGGFETRRTGAFGTGSTVPDHWETTRDNVEVVVGSPDAVSGDGYLKWVNRSDVGHSDSELGTRRAFTVEKDTSYEVAWWVLEESGAIGGATVGVTALAVRWLDYTGATLSDDVVDTVGIGAFNPADDTWYRRSAVVTAPSDARYAKVVIKIVDLCDTVQYLHVDSVRFERA